MLELQPGSLESVKDFSDQVSLLVLALNNVAVQKEALGDTVDAVSFAPTAPYCASMHACMQG